MGENGLTCWRAEMTRIEVVRTAEGKTLRLLRDGDVLASAQLTVEGARALARLLAD
ncbi:hypothetical protein [Roseomonas sp. BN140053]|uniref:hypothetical protein n=1 Tax=Roseomonas sp. BN140053 TaxID=3391898 RepID=UPI0039E8B86B